VQRRIFGREREEIIGCWEKNHSEERYNLYTKPNIIRVCKLMTMRWAGHMTRIERTRNANKILLGNSELRDYGTWKV
jgi:hypothetical protein